MSTFWGRKFKGQGHTGPMNCRIGNAYTTRPIYALLWNGTVHLRVRLSVHPPQNLSQICLNLGC